MSKGKHVRERERLKTVRGLQVRSHYFIDLVDTVIQLPFNPLARFISRFQDPLTTEASMRIDQWYEQRQSGLDDVLRGLKELARDHGLVISKKEILEIWDGAYASAQYAPHALAFVSRIRSLGKRVSIVSNSMAIADRLLSTKQLDKHVP